VAEAFAKVLGTPRAGGGPDSAFRAYLLTTVRHVRYDRTRRERRIELTDITRYETPAPIRSRSGCWGWSSHRDEAGMPLRGRPASDAR
jgi:DNA-directed RNA polymerase specialized sigma24 family protein